MNKKIPLMICAALLFSCPEKQEQITFEAQVHQVKVFKTGTVSEYPEILSFGSISFVNKADVTAVPDANIKSILVREGDFVKKNDLLVILHNPQLDIRLSQAKAGVSSAEAALLLSQAKYREGQLSAEARIISLDRQKMALEQALVEVNELETDYKDKQTLYEVGGIAEKALLQSKSDLDSSIKNYEILKKDMEIKELGLRDADLLGRGYNVPDDPEKRKDLLIKLNTETLAAELDVAKSRLKSAKSELQSTRLLIKDLKIYAPIEGIIGSRYLEQGERVSTGTKVMTIFNKGSVYAVFPVQEKDIVSISKGMKVKTAVDAFDKREFAGEIDIISPIIDPQSGSFTVKAKILNTDNKLKPGMFVRTTIILNESREVIRIPSSCLTRKREDEAAVFIVRGGKAFSSQIKTGKEKNGMTEILSEIDDGELIINFPSPVIMEGDNVEIIE